MFAAYKALTQNENEFVETSSDILNKFVHQSENIFIAGDFNMTIR